MAVRHKEAQRYIACFETLAQLALMRIAWSCEGQSVRGICMPAGTDNTASEAGVNKLFTSVALASLCATCSRLGP